MTAAALALAAIRFYQRHISPRKGFSCALRVVTGGASCSAYGHAVIARFGLARGLGLLRRRLALCSHVHGRLHPSPPPHPRLKYQRGFCDASCDLPCLDYGDCISADTALDVVGCAPDVADCWSSRKRGQRGGRARSSGELDAATERIRRQAEKKQEQAGQADV
jgi:putative component of membrane protein insertase Oxa1/YidC/SpoIIIJ protein YidD